MFKKHTNLPVEVRLQTGARVMFLTNDMIAQGICNGTIGIVTNVDRQAERIHACVYWNRASNAYYCLPQNIIFYCQ